MMTREHPQTETQGILVESRDLLLGASESNRDKTAETFLEILGAWPLWRPPSRPVLWKAEGFREIVRNP